MYTREYLNENGYHCVLGTKCDLLVPKADGDRVVKDIQEFARAHTAPELKLKCEAEGLSKTGTKFDLCLRLFKAGRIPHSHVRIAMSDVPHEGVEALRSEVEALARKHTLAQLREMCDQACVSSVGNKRGLALRILRPDYVTTTTF